MYTFHGVCYSKNGCSDFTVEAESPLLCLLKAKFEKGVSFNGLESFTENIFVDWEKSIVRDLFLYGEAICKANEFEVISNFFANRGVICCYQDETICLSKGDL